MEIARRLRVSDVALGKLCRRAAIPTPGRGHWSRVESGQQLVATQLPPAPAGLPELLKNSGNYAVPRTTTRARCLWRHRPSFILRRMERVTRTFVIEGQEVRCYELDGHRLWRCECADFERRLGQFGDDFCAHTAVATMLSIENREIEP